MIGLLPRVKGTPQGRCACLGGDVRVDLAGRADNGADPIEECWDRGTRAAHQPL